MLRKSAGKDPEGGDDDIARLGEPLSLVPGMGILEVPPDEASLMDVRVLAGDILSLDGEARVRSGERLGIEVLPARGGVSLDFVLGDGDLRLLSGVRDLSFVVRVFLSEDFLAGDGDFEAILLDDFGVDPADLLLVETFSFEVAGSLEHDLRLTMGDLSCLLETGDGVLATFFKGGRFGRSGETDRPIDDLRFTLVRLATDRRRALRGFVLPASEPSKVVVIASGAREARRKLRRDFGTLTPTAMEARRLVRARCLNSLYGMLLLVLALLFVFFIRFFFFGAGSL